MNDRYYYNMNMTLFNTLFWIINVSFFFINQGNFLAYSIKYDGASLFSNTYRLVPVSQTGMKLNLTVLSDLELTPASSPTTWRSYFCPTDITKIQTPSEMATW